MDALALLTNKFQSLTDAEKRVAGYVRQNPAEVILLSLQALAERCGTSDATVLRFCRSLGFSGYIDFKASLIPDLLRQGASLHYPSDSLSTFESAAATLNKTICRDIQSTFSHLDEDIFATVVARLRDAQTVVVIGLAGSAGAARIFVDSLLSVGKAAYYFSDKVEIERICSVLETDDLLIAVSHSGESEEVCQGLERAKKGGVFTCAVTNFAPSRLESQAHVTVLTTVAENLLGSYSCIPRIAQLAIFELLIDQLLQRQRQKEQSDA